MFLKSWMLLLAVLIVYPSFGQKRGLPQAFSLKEAQEIAIKNNPGLQVKSLNAAIAKKQVAQAQWQKIPDLYLNYDLKRNLIIPTTPVPAKAFNPDAPEGKLMPLQFSTHWTSNAGINAKVDLFNPQTHSQVEQATQQAKISKTEEKISTNELRFTVGKDYAACIIALEQLKLAIADTITKSKILAMVKDQYTAGRLKITNLNEAEANKNKAVDNYLEAVKILASARAQLLADMGYDPSRNAKVSLTDSISNLLADYNAKRMEPGENLSLLKKKQQKRLTEIQLANARAGFLPTVSLNGFYGANYFDNNFHLFDQQNWYGNSYIGLSVQLPLTRGIDRVKKIEALHLQQEADQAEYRSRQNQIQLEKTKARQDIAYQEKRLAHKKKNMKLIRKNLQTAMDQFSDGRLLSGDLARNSFLYQQAKTDYLQAAYDFIVAKMTLEKVSRE